MAYNPAAEEGYKEAESKRTADYERRYIRLQSLKEKMGMRGNMWMRRGQWGADCNKEGHGEQSVREEPWVAVCEREGWIMESSL